MAKRISVAVGDSDTTFSGRALSVTALAPLPTVTGNVAVATVVALAALVDVAVAVDESSPQPAPTRHTAMTPMMDMSRFICRSPFARGTIERPGTAGVISRVISS